MSFYFSICPDFPSQTHPLGGAGWKTGNEKQVAARTESGDGSAVWRRTHTCVSFGVCEKGFCDGGRMLLWKDRDRRDHFVRGHSSTSKLYWTYSVLSLHLPQVNYLLCHWLSASWFQEQCLHSEVSHFALGWSIVDIQLILIKLVNGILSVFLLLFLRRFLLEALHSWYWAVFFSCTKSIPFP